MQLLDITDEITSFALYTFVYKYITTYNRKRKYIVPSCRRKPEQHSSSAFWARAALLPGLQYILVMSWHFYFPLQKTFHHLLLPILMSILKIHLLFKNVNKIFFSFAVFYSRWEQKEYHPYEVLWNFCFKILFKTAVFPQASINTLTRVPTACRNLNCTSQSHREIN